MSIKKTNMIIKKIGIALICMMPCFAMTNSNFVYVAYAEENNEDDINSDSNNEYTDDFIEGVDGEAYNVFYRPKTSFITDSEYKEYCKEMYRYGYMDSNYNWTATAQNCIDNPSDETYQKMSEEARQTVDERVQNGEMEAEDNPYYTYEELQQIKNKQEQSANQQNTEGNGSEDDGSMIDDEENTNITETPEESTSETKDSTTEQKTEESEKEEEKETSKTGKVLSYTIIILCITGIAAVAYSIYRKQF